jgi:hypothetical protein
MDERLLSADFLLFAGIECAAGQRPGDTNLDLGLSRRNAPNYRYECDY